MWLLQFVHICTEPEITTLQCPDTMPEQIQTYSPWSDNQYLHRYAHV